MDEIGSSPEDGHEEVNFFSDPETGLRGITVLDTAAPGPCVGACRSRPYIEEERALADALRQAKTTTAKASIAKLPVSGGCTVLLSDSPIGVRAASPLPAIGRAVEALDGRYKLLPDLQGDLKDMELTASCTSHVLGRPADVDIDAVDATAIGLRYGIESAIRSELRRETLTGVRVGIIGLGAIGFRLAEMLRQEGARLTVADRDPRRTESAVRTLGINCVTTEEMAHIDLDVLVPTAAKDAINEGMLQHFRCAIVAGGVDDTLESPTLGQALHDRGILYAPDRVINAGGLVALVQPLLPSDERAVPIREQLQAIGERMDHVIERAKREKLSTAVVADRIAEEALAERIGAQSPQRLAS